MPRPPMDTPSKVQIDKRNGHDKTGQASLSPTLGQYRIKYHLVNGGLLDTDGVVLCFCSWLVDIWWAWDTQAHLECSRGDDLVLACTVLEQ